MDLVVARKRSQESPSYISRLEEEEERVCCCSGGVMAGWCCCGNLASRPYHVLASGSIVSRSIS